MTSIICVFPTIWILFKFQKKRVNFKIFTYPIVHKDVDILDLLKEKMKKSDSAVSAHSNSSSTGKNEDI